MAVMNHPMMLSDTPVHDHRLLEAFRGGDQSAFAELVTRHAAIVYASCRRQLGSADADDATQATFLVLARRPDSAAKAPVLAAWLLRVARNVSSNLRRGRQRRVRAEQEAAVATTTSAAAERAPEPDALAHLDELLDSLPEHERRVVVLHVMQGVDQDEVARLLGCPPGTVRSRLSRGLSRLRDALARRGMVLSLAALATMLASNAGATVPPALLDGLARSPGQPLPADHAVARAANEAERALRPRYLVAGAIGIAATVLIGTAAWWALSSEAAQPTAASAAKVSPRAAPAAVTDAPTPTSDPNAYLPADTNFSVRLNDWHRSIDRLKGTPYAAFFGTPSGAFIAKDLLDDAPKLRQWDSRSLRRAVVAAHLKPGAAQTFVTVAKGEWGRIGEAMEYSVGAELAPRDELIEGSIRQQLAIGGDAADWSATRPWGATVRRGDLLLISNLEHAEGAPPAASAPQVPSYGAADFECVSAANTDASGAAVPAFRMWSTLGEHGIRSERILGTDEPPAQVAPTDARLLRSLPADTLVAYTRRCTAQDLDLAQALAFASLTAIGLRNDDAQQVHGAAKLSVSPSGVDAQVEADERTKERVAAMTQTLGAFGIPTHLTLDGDVLVYARAGEPWPSLTISAQLPEDQGRALVAAAAHLLAAQPGDDGAVAGNLFGLLPLAAVYRDGVVVITTHPDGVAAHFARGGGFDAIPEVADALATIPADAYGACVANGPTAWSALARIAQRFTTDEKTKAGLATLADDLAAACRGHREVMYTTASSAGRRSYAEGPIFGLLGLLIDVGGGGLPLKAIWN
jgi:RNA polymerase sigma factor (sigma-70 family)